MTPDRTIDASGLICPLPFLKARRALIELPAGALLEVVATDGNAEEDMAALCESGGHELVLSARQDGVYRFLIRKRR